MTGIGARQERAQTRATGVGRSTARRWSIGGWTLGLAIAVCLLARPSPAADPALARYDGIYTGTFVPTATAGWAKGSEGCEENKLEQKMSIADGQVYLDRKYNDPNTRLLLSGTVSAEGQVSAAGAFVPQMPQSHRVWAQLRGKMEANQFNGQFTISRCDFTVTLRKTS